MRVGPAIGAFPYSVFLPDAAFADVCVPHENVQVTEEQPLVDRRVEAKQAASGPASVDPVEHVVQLPRRLIDWCDRAHEYIESSEGDQQL